jgi:hypothetical protein
LAAFFLLEIVADALDDLAMRDSPDLSTLLKDLQKQQETDNESRRGELDARTAPEYFENLVDEIDRAGLDIALLAKGSNYCHTARRPAEIRRRNTLSEAEAVSRDDADTTVDDNGGNMLLAYEKETSDCNETLRLDFSDYFYTKTIDDWRMLVLPTDREIQVYRKDKEAPRGMLAICFAACPYNKCPRGNLDRESFEEGLFQMTVNDKAVSNMVQFGDCELLQNADAAYQWSPNDDGKFFFKVKVEEPKSFVRIGAFIIF